jgi:hypothetical protein
MLVEIADHAIEWVACDWATFVEPPVLERRIASGAAAARALAHERRMELHYARVLRTPALGSAGVADRRR